MVIVISDNARVKKGRKERTLLEEIKDINE